jgi:hypothetical protein
MPAVLENYALFIKVVRSARRDADNRILNIELELWPPMSDGRIGDEDFAYSVREPDRHRLSVT